MPRDNDAGKEKVYVSVANLPRIRAREFYSGFTNHVEANHTFTDLRLTFCQLVRQIGEDQKPKLVIQEEATFAMSWEHGVLLRDLLTKVIAEYEEESGAVRRRRTPSDERDKKMEP